MKCDTCGTEDATRVVIKYHPLNDPIDRKSLNLERTEYCNRCENTGIGPSYNRDALGNRVQWSEAQAGKFNFATGKAHSSQKDYADHLKREGLVQKGNDGRLSNKSMGRISK